VSVLLASGRLVMGDVLCVATQPAIASRSYLWSVVARRWEREAHAGQSAQAPRVKQGPVHHKAPHKQAPPASTAHV
jgi:hypothetical protein